MSQWPAVAYEKRPWQTDGSASRSSRRKHAGPYDAAIPASISHRTPVISTELAADLAEAEAALSRFDEYVSSVLGAGTTELAPLGTVLLRTESVASSRIENLTVGARQIALTEIGEGTNRNAAIVTRNVRTMEAAVALADALRPDTLLRLHDTLLRDSDPEHAGRLRDEQVWIGGSNVGPHHAAFVPPHHERLADSLADLFAFLDRDDIPLLAHAAIAHAQFETIHPFTDGNGRTGRAIVHALLRHGGVTSRSTVPVSAGLLRDLDRYFAALDAYRTGDPAPIIRSFCDASRFAADRGRILVSELDAIRTTNRERITARSDSAAYAINDLLPGQPIINTVYVTTRLGISQPAATRAIDRLVAAGVVTETSNRARHRVWQSNEILAVLDEFAESIRRRSAPY